MPDFPSRPEHRRRRRPSVPAEVLYDIFAPVIMDAIDKLVYASPKEYHALWQANIAPLLMTSKRFNSVATGVLCDALDIAQDATGRPLEEPSTVLWAMRADSDAVEGQVHIWQRAADSGKLVAPTLYRGRPLERLYRLSEYGPWYFRTRAILCNTVDELRDLRRSMLDELEETVDRLKFPGLRKYICRRMARVEHVYSNGCETMECALKLRIMQDKLTKPSAALITASKKEVPGIARRLAHSTQKTDPSQPVEMWIANHALSNLVKTLHAMNDPDTDHSVKYFFCEKQPAAIEELWFELVDTRTSHAQRRRLVHDVPLGFVPTDLASPRLAEFRHYTQQGKQASK